MSSECILSVAQKTPEVEVSFLLDKLKLFANFSCEAVLLDIVIRAT